MRFVFMDEAGISEQEPIALVVGVFVHGDKQLVPVEAALKLLIVKHIPEEDREGFVFHTKDIFLGTKYFKDRNKWPWERRARLLLDLSRVPAHFGLPVVFQATEKRLAKFRTIPEQEVPRADRQNMIHGSTFCGCTIRADVHMRRWHKGEIAQLIAENNNEMRKYLKISHSYLVRPQTDVPIEFRRLLPLRHIRTGILFAEKPESPALQLADLSAYLITRRLSRGDDRCVQFYKNLLPVMQQWPAMDGDPDKD